MAVEDSSKTMIKGKQYNTNFGGTTKDEEIYDARSQDRRD